MWVSCSCLLFGLAIFPAASGVTTPSTCRSMNGHTCDASSTTSTMNALEEPSDASDRGPSSGLNADAAHARRKSWARTGRAVVVGRTSRIVLKLIQPHQVENKNILHVLGHGGRRKRSEVLYHGVHEETQCGVSLSSYHPIILASALPPKHSSFGQHGQVAHGGPAVRAVPGRFER
jgi:hypothetical protein